MRSFLVLTVSASVFMSLASCSSRPREQTTAQIEPVVVETLINATESWSGDAFSYPSGQARMVLQRITAQPGFKTPLHFHPQPGIVYVAQGNLSCGTVDGQSLEVASGESFAASQSQAHYCEVTSNDPALIFVSYAASKGQELTMPFE